jgi:class 3 adenylate cyclase
LADAIPNARFVAVEGQDSMAWLGDAETLLGEIEEFLTGARTPGRPSELATILFTDIVGSTEMATRLHHEQWQRLLREHDQLVRAEVERCGGTVIKEIGDGVLATFDTPDRAVTAADEAVRAAAQLELELRAGIHVGVVERLPDDVRGVAVHIAARITERAAPGQVLVSSTVNDILVDSGLTLTAVSEERLRGVPGTWTLYALGRADATSARPRGSRHGVRGSAMRERGRPHPRPRA